MYANRGDFVITSIFIIIDFQPLNFVKGFTPTFAQRFSPSPPYFRTGPFSLFINFAKCHNMPMTQTRTIRR